MFSMTAPITKVVKNDAYTAPRAPVPVAPTRPSNSTAAARSSAAALKPVSRTLQQSSAEPSAATPTPPQVHLKKDSLSYFFILYLENVMTELIIIIIIICFCLWVPLKKLKVTLQSTTINSLTETEVKKTSALLIVVFF